MTNPTTPTYYTVRFDSFGTAKAVCEKLGFWRKATAEAPEGPIADGVIMGSDGKIDRGFSIIVIGQDPILPDGTKLTGYYANIAGKLPAAVANFEVPYRSAGGPLFSV
jgi:hypothetical protein